MHLWLLDDLILGPNKVVKLVLVILVEYMILALLYTLVLFPNFGL